MNSLWHVRTFGQRLLAAGGLGENLLALGDGLAPETDALLRVENGSLPDQRLDASRTTVDLVERDLSNNLGAMIPITRQIGGKL